MSLFDMFSVSRAIATVVGTPAPTDERTAAIKRLRAQGSRIVPKLVEALSRDPHNALGPLLAELITNATLPDLVTKGLLSENTDVVSRARNVLLAAKHIDPNRVFELYVGKGGSVINIAEYLAQRKDAVNAKSMLRLLEFAREDNQPAVFALIDRVTNKSMVPALIGFLKNCEWDARARIAQTIARFPSESVRDALLRLLGDPHKAVRQAALQGIAGLGMPVAVAPVCALLRDPDMLVQTLAIDTLVKLNDPGSVKHLLEILQDESEHSRRAAVEVLNAVGNANAIKDLFSALKDQDWWVRVRAADALGSIGGPKVIDAVLELINDDDEFMRRTAVEILNTTKDPRAFEHLVKALGDADWWVKERAIDALANLGNKLAVPHLIPLLADDTQATSVAIRALAQIGDPRAVAPILAKLKTSDEAIQRETVEALGSLTTPAQQPVVLQWLGKFSPANEDIREMAHRVTSELAAKHARSAPKRAAPAAAATSPAIKHAEATNDRPPPQPVTQPADQTIVGSMDDLPPPANADAKTLVIQPVRNVSGPSSPGFTSQHDLSAIAPGQILAERYKIIREIGKGGFGTVIQVADQMVGEEIALKIINPQLVEDEGTLDRFMLEVRYARKIAHKNVIRVHDFLMVGGYYAISMEYFASHPLARRIRSKLHQDQDQGVKFLRDIASGIHVAHQANIMHRDLKPANLLVNDDGALKIVDFGLAAASSGGDSRVTKTGHLVGTPTYMSPEQARGLTVDCRTDIYSLGVIMYEMFTGTVPYSGDNPMAVLFQHVEGKKAPPSSRNPLVSPALESIILKAMAVDPDSRFQSAHELLCALDQIDVRVAA